MTNEELTRKITEVECQTKSNTEDIKVLDSKVSDIHRIATSVEIIANDMSYMKNDLSEVKDGQKELQKNQKSLQTELTDVKNASAQRKAKLIDGIGEKIIWLIIGGILAGILAILLPQFF